MIEILFGVTETIRAGSPSGNGDRSRPIGLCTILVSRKEQERAMRRGAGTSRSYIRPTASPNVTRTQPRLGVRRVHSCQCRREDKRLHQQPSSFRIYYVEGSVLRARSLQWARNMHSRVEPLPQQRRVRVLGSVPPDGTGESAHSPEYDDWVYQVYEPHEPKHHISHGFQLLMEVIYEHSLENNLLTIYHEPRRALWSIVAIG